MEEIPMPSSGDDSPGPPGEEHVQTERFNKKPTRKESPVAAAKDESKGLSYSPSMETSSPEYESGKDFGKKFSEKSPLISHNKRGNDYQNESRSPSIRPRFISKSQDNTEETSKLTPQSVGRHSQKSFSSSNKGGTISFGINKVKKVGKHGSVSSFSGLDDEDLNRISSTQRNSPIEHFNGQDGFGRKGSSSKRSSSRYKEPSKMNIDSIIEEENRERALIGGRTVIPKIQMIEIPSDQKGHSLKDQDSNRNIGRSTGQSIYSRNSDRLNIGTTVDKWGFVINSNALNRDSKVTKSETEDTKSRHRYHSPYQSRKIEFLEDVQTVPSSWKECKEKGIDIFQIRQIKEMKQSDKREHKQNLDSLMISADSALTAEQLLHSSTSDLKSSNNYSLECEIALRNLLSKVEKKDGVFTEYSIKEFPKICVKKTHTDPPVQWSYHPRHDSAAYIMPRKDILEEASTDEIEYLMAIMNDNAINRKKHDRLSDKDSVGYKSWYGIENSFLQKDVKLNNSLLKLSAHVEPDGNIADIKDTHTNDSINEEQLRNNVAQNTVSSNDQNEKKKKKKRKKEKGNEDLLSAFLTSKKKKKKHSQEKNRDTYTNEKGSKKKRKEKNQLKTEEILDMIGGSELPWEDPEKLVQLNTVVSMGSRHSRSDHKQKGLPTKDKKNIEQIEGLDSDGSLNSDKRHISGFPKAGIYREDTSKNEENIKTPSPLNYSKSHDSSKDSRKSDNKLIEKKDSHVDYYHNEKSEISRTNSPDERKKTQVNLGPRTPPTPRSKNSLHRRTGPRTPSPQPCRMSTDHKRDFENFTDEEQYRNRYDRDVYDGRNRQLSPYQGPRRDEVDYASNDFQIKKERNRGFEQGYGTSHRDHDYRHHDSRIADNDYRSDPYRKDHIRRSRDNSRSPIHREHDIPNSPITGRRISPRYSRHDRYRRFSPSSSHRYPRRSPEGRSPPHKFSRLRDRRRASISPSRREFSSYYKGIRTPSPAYLRRRHVSPMRDHELLDREGVNYTHYSSFSQPQPDSTINDKELLSAEYINPRYRYSSNDHGSSNLFHSDVDHRHTHLLPIDCHGPLNSPKRLSLDERLERELGIKVKGENRMPDYTRPPPGYLASGERLEQSSTLQSNCISSDSHILVHTQNSNLNQSVTTVRTTQLGIVPTYSDPPKLSSTTEFSNAFPNENPPSASFIDTPEEGKLVRVGNMLQIVPESDKASQNPIPSSSVVLSDTNDMSLTSKINSFQNDDEAKTKELLLKVEEMGRRKDAERRKRREQRMAERLQQSKCSNEIYDGIKDEDQEMDKSPGDSQGACNQSIKTEGYKQSINEASDMSQYPKEESLNPQAYNTNSMTEFNTIMSGTIESSAIPSSTDETHHGKIKKKAKNKSEVRYISLKPLDKREKRRQEKIQAMRRMVKKAVRNAGKGITNEASLDEDSITSFDAEEFIPRSPVPLPDVSSCKPILVQLGFSLSKKEKKVLRYADGVLPGQGSPDHSEDASTTTGPLPPQSLATLPVKKPKKRKRIRLTIIEQISPSDNDDGVIPPPPPGSPPMLSMKEFLARYPISTPALPMQIAAAVN